MIFHHESVWEKFIHRLICIHQHWIQCSNRGSKISLSSLQWVSIVSSIVLLKSSITFWILSWPSSSSKRATGIVSSDVVTWSSYLSLLTLLISTALSINTYILVFVLDWQHIVWLCCKNYIYIIHHYSITLLLDDFLW